MKFDSPFVETREVPTTPPLAEAAMANPGGWAYDIDHEYASDQHVPKRSAAHNPGQWISEIDPDAEHLFPEIPEDRIRGWWLVDPNGQITRNFRPNSRYPASD